MRVVALIALFATGCSWCSGAPSSGPAVPASFGRTRQDLQLSPDGKRLAFERSEPQPWRAVIVDTADWSERLSVDATRFVLTPDWSTMVAAKSLESGVRLLDPATGRERQRFTAATGIGDIALSRDGKLLAAAHLNDGVVEIWDVPSGRSVLTTRDAGFGGLRVEFAADGKSLVGTSLFGARVWSLPDGAEHTPLARKRLIVTPAGRLAEPRVADAIERIAAHHPARSDFDLLRIDLDPEAKRAAVHAGAASGPWNPVEIAPLDGGAAIPAEGPGGDCRPTLVRFSPDGSALLVGYANESVWVIDAATGKSRRVLDAAACDAGAGGTGPSIAWFSDGKRLLLVRPVSDTLEVLEPLAQAPAASGK